MKVTIASDDIKLKSNLNNNQSLIFTKKSFLYTILGFNLSHSASLNDMEGFVKLTPDKHKSEKPINITAVHNVHIKCDCVIGSIVNGFPETILHSFALSSPPGHKIYKKSRNKLFKKINKSVLSPITFYLEDDDHKPVNFNGKSISFTCQLIKV